jgi:hypothetical protein
MTINDVPLMNPVLRRGRSYLDRELLPGDENESRLTALLAEATERDLAGVVVFAAAHLPEDLVYYANYTPTTFHGALVARPGEPPVLLAGKGGGRDHPYIRTVSWVQDVRYAADYGATLTELTAEWGDDARIGVVGLDTTLPHAVRAGVVAALGDRLVPIDDVVATQRRRKSARERAVLARARGLAEEAAAAAVDAYAGGAGRRTALAAADFAARAGGAHDCRLTVGTEGGVGTLAELDDAAAPASALIAVEYLGYWGFAAVDLSGGDPDVAALDAVVAGLRAGLLPGDVIGADRPGSDLYLINGIGTGYVERPGPEDGLAEGDVVAIVRVRRGLDGTRFAVRTALVGVGGGREL